MDSREAISELFNIPKDEEIYEGITCTYHGAINSTGKLYCCENYFCFYASLMGVPVKHVLKVDSVEYVIIGDEYFELFMKKEKDAAKGKSYKFSKFAGGKETTNRAFRLITQIVGEDKIQKPQVAKDEQTSNQVSEKPAVQNLGTLPEVQFDNFFGPDVKELFKVSVPFSGEKVAQCLLGPKSPIFGFEHVLPSIDGMEFIRAEPWEENVKNSCYTRKLVYTHRRMDNVYLNKELFEDTQTFALKG